MSDIPTININEDLLLRVQYNWVFDIVKRMEVVINGESTEEEKLQQIGYLIKQALKAESRDND